MFENEIKFISDFSLNKVKNLGSFVTFEKLSATSIHPAIITYISAELDYMISRDRKKLLQDSIFDYSGKVVSEHFKAIAKEIKQSKKISIDDLNKLILQAVSFNVHYVVRPKWSLTKLIYNDQDFVHVEELERMLGYLYYYDYVKNVLTAYISKRKVIQLTLTEFDLILNKIDRELFKSNAEELINNALLSIADFFNIGGIDKNKISLYAVEILLKEKNLMDYLLKLRRAIPDGSKKKYEIKDIKSVLYSTSPVKPDSVHGYEPDEVELLEQVEGEPLPETSAVNNEYEETEIVTEGMIQSEPELDDQITSVGEEPITEESEPEIFPQENIVEEINREEELLPIEEEYQNELQLSDLKKTEPDILEEAREIEEQLKANAGKEQNLESELSELMEEEISFAEDIPESKHPVPEEEYILVDEETEQEAEESRSKEDELLAFYENELASMDEDLSDLLVPKDELEEEKVEEIADTEVKAEEEPEPMVVEEEETQPAEESVMDKDDFDLFIFDEAQEEIITDEASDKFKEESEEDSELTDDVTQNVIEDTSKPETETSEEPETTSDSALEKEIINEMLEDYFRDEINGVEPLKQDLSLGDESEIKTPEVPTPLSDDEPVDVSNEEFKIEDDDIFSGKEISSAMFDDTSMDDDISGVMEEIDGLIEENTLSSLEQKTETEGTEPRKVKDTKKEHAYEEEKKVEDVDIFKDLPAEDEFKFEEPPAKQKIKTPLPKAEVPDREKDFFTYLTKKEMKKIVSNVFGGDDEDFVTTIERVSECSSYREATEILKDVFFSYRVSPYSKEAVLLTNAVSNFFRQS